MAALDTVVFWDGNPLENAFNVFHIFLCGVASWLFINRADLYKKADLKFKEQSNVIHPEHVRLAFVVPPIFRVSLYHFLLFITYGLLIVGFFLTPSLFDFLLSVFYLAFPTELYLSLVIPLPPGPSKLQEVFDKVVEAMNSSVVPEPIPVENV